MNLARRFNGTVNLTDQPIPVSFSKVGDVDNPDLIVTSLKVEIGVILKRSKIGNDRYYIDSTSKHIPPAAREELEAQLNEIIKTQGVPVELHHEPCSFR